MNIALKVNTKMQLKIKHLAVEDLNALNFKLNIICADDAYFNLEALRVVFKNLGMLPFCQFVADGKQVVDLCIKNYNEMPPNLQVVNIVIIDF